jgi:hypothetical protein
MSGNFNYIDSAKEIESILRKDNFVEEANLLEDSISNNSTGTEICMALRFTSSNLSKDKRIPSFTRKFFKRTK